MRKKGSWTDHQCFRKLHGRINLVDIGGMKWLKYGSLNQRHKAALARELHQINIAKGCLKLILHQMLREDVYRSQGQPLWKFVVSTWRSKSSLQLECNRPLLQHIERIAKMNTKDHLYAIFHLKTLTVSLLQVEESGINGEKIQNLFATWERSKSNNTSMLCLMGLHIIWKKWRDENLEEFYADIQNCWYYDRGAKEFYTHSKKRHAQSILLNFHLSSKTLFEPVEILTCLNPLLKLNWQHRNGIL